MLGNLPDTHQKRRNGLAKLQNIFNIAKQGQLNVTNYYQIDSACQSKWIQKFLTDNKYITDHTEYVQFFRTIMDCSKNIQDPHTIAKKKWPEVSNCNCSKQGQFLLHTMGRSCAAVYITLLQTMASNYDVFFKE